MVCGQTKQAEEDGLADTVKPRLTALGADCSRVLAIDESERELTLSDRRLAQAIQETNAGLFVLGPIQAYLGDGVDIHRAPRHADSKTLRKERQKKIALGYKADDHEDEHTQQQTM